MPQPPRVPAVVTRRAPRRRVLVLGALLLVSVGVVVAVVLAGSSEPAQVSGVTVRGDGSRLVVEYVAPSESCGGEAEVDVTEDDDEVVVTVVIRRPFELGTRACLPRGRIAHADVDLESPLGARAVVNGTTGEPVAVTRETD